MGQAHQNGQQSSWFLAWRRTQAKQHAQLKRRKCALLRLYWIPHGICGKPFRSWDNDRPVHRIKARAGRLSAHKSLRRRLPQTPAEGIGEVLRGTISEPRLQLGRRANACRRAEAIRTLRVWSWKGHCPKFYKMRSGLINDLLLKSLPLTKYSESWRKSSSLQNIYNKHFQWN